MKEINIITKTALLDTYIYEITLDNSIYKGIFSPASFIQSIIKERKPFLSKISVLNKNSEILSIYKNYKTPLTDILYTIYCRNRIYSVIDSKNCRIPGFFIPTDFGNLEVSGTVADGKYTVSLAGRTSAVITSAKNKDLKQYSISHSLEFNHCNELLISIVLIIDSLYHYY